MPATTVRNIIQIDESLCTGCGQCVLDCAEGAITIVNGKAKVVSESYCDGLGACLAGCPADALTIVQRKAVPFDEKAALRHVAATRGTAADTGPSSAASRAVSLKDGLLLPAQHTGGCPGATPRQIPLLASPAHPFPTAPLAAPGRKTWPVKLRLLTPAASFLRGADILLTADCGPAASQHYHELLGSKIPVLACPKFDDNEDILHRLQAILAEAKPASLAVLRMEVPCCRALAILAVKAAARARCGLEVQEIVLGCNGELAVTPFPQPQLL